MEDVVVAIRNYTMRLDEKYYVINNIRSLPVYTEMFGAQQISIDAQAEYRYLNLHSTQAEKIRLAREEALKFLVHFVGDIHNVSSSFALEYLPPKIMLLI